MPKKIKVFCWVVAEFLLLMFLDRDIWSYPFLARKKRFTWYLCLNRLFFFNFLVSYLVFYDKLKIVDTIDFTQRKNHYCLCITQFQLTDFFLSYYIEIVWSNRNHCCPRKITHLKGHFNKAKNYSGWKSLQKYVILLW